MSISIYAEKVTTVSSTIVADVADDGTLYLTVDGTAYTIPAAGAVALAQAIIPAATAEDADGTPAPTDESGTPVLTEDSSSAGTTPEYPTVDPTQAADGTAATDGGTPIADSISQPSA